MASHGYLFPIDDHFLTVKNDGSFYRFQTPYFWPSNNWEPENTDYGKLIIFLLQLHNSQIICQKIKYDCITLDFVLYLLTR